MTSQQLDVLRDQLKNEMSASSPNLQKVGQLLTQAKVKKKKKNRTKSRISTLSDLSWNRLL